jgi:hypothetical protein
MLGPFHWLHEISLPRRVWHYFWRGLKARAKNTRPICLLVQSMGGGKSSCWKFYNPQLQTMFNVLCCPASPYYYKRILQSVLSTGLLYKRILQSVFGPFHLELCFCPWQRSCEPLWSIGIYSTQDLQQTRKKGARWVVMTLKQGKEGKILDHVVDQQSSSCFWYDYYYYWCTWHHSFKY